MDDQLSALIKYIEKKDNAEMVSLPEGFIMVKKTKNNCRHHGTDHTKDCDSGVNCVCPGWEFGG